MDISSTIEILTPLLRENADEFFTKKHQHQYKKTRPRKPGQENQAKQPGQENQNGLTMDVMQQNKSLNALEIFFQRNNTPGNRIAFTRSRTKYNRIRMKTKYKFKVKQG